MESRADRVRGWMEGALRAAALLLLAWCLFATLRPAPAAEGRAERAGAGDDLRAALERWSTRTLPTAVEVELAAAPAPEERAWLRAARRSGTAVAWRDAGVPALAVELVPENRPGGGAWALVAAPEGSLVRLRDALGPLDTVRAAGPGASLYLPDPRGPVVASIDGDSASAVLRDSLASRRVLVLGRAGWEAKFAAAALEEAGWDVDARFAVAPGLAVVQGAPAAPDTARYAAVVAVDETAASQGAAIARFVRAGGGVVLLGEAAGAPGLAALAAGGVGGRVAAPAEAFAAEAPRRALDLLPVAEPRGDAVVLERRGAVASVAARRVESGRTLQVGYLDSWRWRMLGPEGPAAHREWWSALVGAAAYRAASPVAAAPADPAPRAGLFAALGPPAAAEVAREGVPRRLPPWALPLLLALLLGEWASRRARGAR